MPGQLEFIEPRGERLVALGHTNEAGQPFQLAVSLIDVSNLASPKLLSRVIFGSSWSWVTAQPDDLRKAFIVLDPPPDGIGLILVPVQGWDATSYTSIGGTQLVDFGHDALTLRGFLSHPGNVARAFPADDAGTRLVAFSDTLLQTIDATDRDAPQELGRLELARWVQSLAPVQGKVVELAGDWYRGETSLVVTDALTPDAEPPLARLSVAAPYAVMFHEGAAAWLLAQDWRTGAAWIQAVDLTDPLHPALRGKLDLLPGATPWLGGFGWGAGDSAVLVGRTLAIHRPYGSCYADQACVSVTGDVVLYDLRDLDHPRRAAAVPLTGASWAWGLQAHGNFAWLTHFAGDAWSGRFYADRIDVSDPDHPALLAQINIPGILTGASDDGRVLYTLEAWWGSGNAITTYLHRLELTSSGRARLTASLPMAGYPSGSVAMEDGRGWLLTSSGSGATQLSAVSLADLTVTSRQTVQGWAWLQKAAGGKLFLQAGWTDQGVLIYDLADPARPRFEQLVRTQGWISDVVVANGLAYLPSGPYGVPVVTLSGP